MHMTDLFASIAGLTDLAEKKPVYTPTKDEMTWAFVAYPRAFGKKRVCVQIGAGEFLRVYPGNLMQEAMAQRFSMVNSRCL